MQWFCDLGICGSALQHVGWEEGGLKVYDQKVMSPTRSRCYLLVESQLQKNVHSAKDNETYHWCRKKLK